jgi:hypothetical protein
MILYTNLYSQLYAFSKAMQVLEAIASRVRSKKTMRGEDLSGPSQAGAPRLHPLDATLALVEHDRKCKITTG